ncbi:MAG: hypothetical protein ABH867_04170 [Patescibacteria group bacterium]|nr:hypothetical protein [Patescibacteria group bacterium]
MKKNLLPSILKISFFIFFIGTAISAIYFYSQYRKVVRNTDTNEAEQLISTISELIELPPDEVPTVATVSDKNKLQDYPFFGKAENGDKVLIYAQAEKAILYRPSTGKIVDVGPVKTVDQEEEATPTPTTVPSSEEKGATIKVVLYNGTNTVGITSKVEEPLLEVLDEIEIVEKLPAEKKDYQNTLVIDLSNNFPSVTTAIADFLNAEVAALPEGENKPDGDILIIVGRDKE